MQMWKDIPSTVAGHVKAGNVNWPMTIYIALVHVVAIIGAFQIPNCSKETLLFSVILWSVSFTLLTLPIIHSCLISLCAVFLTLPPSNAHLFLSQSNTQLEVH